MKNKLISIIVPFFNEEESISHFYKSISLILRKLNEYDIEVICVDDGSTDSTLKELITLAAVDRRFLVIELSRNFGKESALSAGIDLAKGDAIIPLDADLQDPPNLIYEMIERWLSGSEVVLACRENRVSDTFMKRKSAELFYKLHNKISEIKIPENVGDFRLMDRVVVDAIKKLPERQRFMKGIFAWVGFKTDVVYYSRDSRVAGKSKFSPWKLWNLAIDGITSFSIAPLKFWTYIGLSGAFFSGFYALFIISRTLIYGIEVPGYASILVAILFFGSLQLISIGILGEYIGRIYIESKDRPIYIVRKKYGFINES